MISFSAIRKLLSGNRGRHNHVGIDVLGLTDFGSDKRTHLRWSDVERIYGERLDKVTFDENYLVFEGLTGVIFVGELDEEFQTVVHQVRERFPGIPEDWMASLEETERKIVHLWPNAASDA